MSIKIYGCKICYLRGILFTGIRSIVRKHIREEHRIKGGQMETKEKRVIGKIANNTLVIDCPD